MTSWAYYNEIDGYAADWLRNLIRAGHIAPGEVDTRSIEDVHPLDVKGFTQCHWFAGIGVWSHALRLAGWADSRPVWTGSCPCQPFSAAGQGVGFDDERHLWPHFHWLIQECRPPVVLGEQVASKDADPWIDLVQDDLEALGYAVGAVPFPAAGVGAPHIRDRLYWVGYSGSARGALGLSAPTRRHEGLAGIAHDAGGQRAGAGPRSSPSGTGCGVAGGLADATSERRNGRQDTAGARGRAGSETSGAIGRMAHSNGGHASTERQQRSGEQRQQPEDGGALQHARPGPTNGLWRSADWLLCRDGKWRPVEPGTFPLAHGASSRVGRLRAYGNAINAEAARCFIESVMEVA